MYEYFEINEQGNKIRCKMYYFEKSAIEKAVIFCTGFAGHKDNNAANRFAEELLSEEKGVAVVVFNWPAHGDDIKKKLVLNDCITYLDLVICEIKNKMAVQKLYAYATSFGGYLLLKYISEHGNPFNKISLRCPAVNMYDVLTKVIMKKSEYDRVMKGENVEVGFDRKVIVTRFLLDEMKANQGIKGYQIIKLKTSKKALLVAKIKIVPIEAVEDFDLTVELADSIEVTE